MGRKEREVKMTLLELCETNGHIVLMDISVRDENLRLMHTYRIGSDAHLFKGDDANRTTVLNRPLHVQQDGAENFQFGFVTKSLPKELRKMEVAYWYASHAFGCKITDAVDLRVDVISGKNAEQMKVDARQEIEADQDPDQISFF